MASSWASPSEWTAPQAAGTRRAATVGHGADERLEHLAHVAHAVDRRDGLELVGRGADGGDAEVVLDVDDAAPAASRPSTSDAVEVVAEHLHEHAVRRSRSASPARSASGLSGPMDRAPPRSRRGPRASFASASRAAESLPSPAAAADGASCAATAVPPSRASVATIAANTPP